MPQTASFAESQHTHRLQHQPSTIVCHPRQKVAPWRLMSWVAFVVLLIVGAGVILFLGGCQSLGGKSNSQQYQLAAQSYTFTVNAVTRLSQLNLIELDDLEKFDQARAMADALLTQWHQALIAGGSFGGVDALNALLDEMIRIQLTHEDRSQAHGPIDRPGYRQRSHQARRRAGRHHQRRQTGRPRFDAGRAQHAGGRPHAFHHQLPG